MATAREAVALAGAVSGPGFAASPASYYEALFPKVMDPDYVAGLRAATGYETLAAKAAVMARVSLARSRVEANLYTLWATGGARARGEVSLARTSASAAAAVTVEAGSVVSTADGAHRYRTLAPVTFGVGALGPVLVDVEAEAEGYAENQPGAFTDQHGDAHPGAVDTVAELTTTPAYLPGLALTVTQPADIAGGVDAGLDVKALDRRGLRRASGESDVSLRARLRAAPDTVSPGAVERACRRVLGPYNLPFRVWETWSVGYQTALDAPPVADPFDPAYDEATFVLDDPRTDLARNRYLSRRSSFVGVVVQVQPIPTVAETSFVLDDPGLAPGDRRSNRTNGVRGVPAYDVPVGWEVAGAGRAPALDGVDPARAGLYVALNAAVRGALAAGVPCVILVEGELE